MHSFNFFYVLLILHDQWLMGDSFLIIDHRLLWYRLISLLLLLWNLEASEACLDNSIEQVDEEASKKPLLPVSLHEVIPLCVQHHLQYCVKVCLSWGRWILLGKVNFAKQLIRITSDISKLSIYFIRSLLDVKIIVFRLTSAIDLLISHLLLKDIHQLLFISLRIIRTTKEFFAFLRVIGIYVILSQVQSTCIRNWFI